MLDMGFIQPIRRILALLPAERQNLLFSATFTDDIRQLAGGILHDPASVQVAPRNTAAELVDQLVIPVDRERKRELLSHLVRTRRIDQALVFTRTKHGANRLAEQLDRDGIAAAAIHGNKSQGQRVRALDDFKAGRATILVATDIAARAASTSSRCPTSSTSSCRWSPEDYVHRIGRTGRAGIDGEAISLVCVDEAPLLRDIERLLRHPIPSEVVAGLRARPIDPPRADPAPLRAAATTAAGTTAERMATGGPTAARTTTGHSSGGLAATERPSAARHGPVPSRGGAANRGRATPRVPMASAGRRVPVDRRTPGPASRTVRTSRRRGSHATETCRATGDPAASPASGSSATSRAPTPVLGATDAYHQVEAGQPTRGSCGERDGPLARLWLGYPAPGSRNQR